MRGLLTPFGTHGKGWVSVMMGVIVSLWHTWKGVGQSNEGLLTNFGTHGKGGSE